VSKKVFALFIFSSLIMYAFSQQADSVLQQHIADSVLLQHTVDSALLRHGIDFAQQKNFWQAVNHPVINDIQQYKSTTRNVFVFIILMVMLGVLTYIKTAFGKDLQEMLQSVYDKNLSQQIFRTQTREITFSSALLSVNFILMSALFVQFFLIKYYHATTLENISGIFFLIFLFTLFYVGKLILLQLIGVLFEVKQECDEYAFIFTSFSKTLGLTLIPALFVFYCAQEKFSNFIFIITVFVCAFFFLLLVWRGLSTAYKLMYRSLYHFFIYVCLVEISPIFLLFKLLTKTII
jgi:hypothetical protein